MGPSFFAQHKGYSEKLFSLQSRLILGTFAEFGIMMHSFKIGVQVNPHLLMKIGAKELVVGLTGYIVPLVVSLQAFRVIKYDTSIDSELEAGIAAVAMINALTSFVVTNSLLHDLNILNSDIGRMALSTSIVSDFCGWLMSFVVVNIGHALTVSNYRPLMEVAILLSYYCFLFLVVRPLVTWIADHTPQGKPMKESHFFAIIIVLLLVGLTSQCLGQPAFFSTFIFGLFLPDGPPLGAILAQKFDIIGSAVLVPIYCTITGFKVDIASLRAPMSATIELVIILGYIGKFTGTLLPSLYFEIPFWDALALAVIMCCKGIVDLSIIINTQVLSLLIFSMVIMTGLATPIVNYLYDPSKRYMAYIRKTIMNTDQEDLELRILVCVHNEENVYPIINLLEASNPTRDNPISIFVLQLIDLSGRAASVLLPNQKLKKSYSKGTCSEHIVNAFNQFEHHNQGYAMVQHFTSIAPYGSMHNDICTLALDQKTNIVIIPFHKQWTIGGNIDHSSPSIRTLNQNVLIKAPCSVGVLIDRGQMTGKRSVTKDDSNYHIAMLFAGGADDKEALAYGMRMAEHPKIRLTVIWFKALRPNRHSKSVVDIDVMDDVRAFTEDKENMTHRQEIVKDGAGTTQVIRSIEGIFDLIIVGRHHEPDSPITIGLTEWSVCPELGLIGDMLASSDFTFSVLVVQQQPFRCGLKDIQTKDF
ncbi:Cation/H(+) antiporter like [Quillaja saponaria]|uniref:Cation/H(+) antiporter like n=1 Tax=Quillaja saponaria TaxID=32244 RepID=A0AAD7LTY9_QUISA|nr:Cation/H(+) antiporter like [Quillaja saponaria]